MKLIDELKQSKYYRLLVAVIIAVVALLLAMVGTHFIAQWNADESSEQEIRIQNLLTMQKDSLESVYLFEKIEALDSLEVIHKSKAEQTNKEVAKLKSDLKTEKDKTADLKEKLKNFPTLENCQEVVSQQDRIIDKQYQVIDSLDAEAQEWCELYDNENAKGTLKDTLIAGKTRTIQTLNSEVKTLGNELQIINTKLDKARWWKRNWLWATNSYRNWLKNR